MADDLPAGADLPPGPGYWKASDGNWYPPASHPAAPPPPPPMYGAIYGTPQAPGGGVQANGMATAALVLGIVGICLFWLLGLGAFLGLLAVIFGAIGLSKAKSLPGEPLKGRAQAGLVTGIVAIVAGIAFFVIVVAAVDGNLNDINYSDVDSDPSDGVCNPDRYMQDPDC